MDSTRRQYAEKYAAAIRRIVPDDHVGQADSLVRDLEAELTRVEQENERLRQALTSYAAKENWSKCSICEGPIRSHFVGPVIGDGGFHAREALDSVSTRAQEG